MILRNFLFLDTKMLNDYLATIEGHTQDGPISQTEYKKSEKKGKAGYKVAEGELSTEKSTEIKKNFAFTDAAKFQHFYEVVEENNMYSFLDLFDDEYWSNLRRGELIEAEILLQLPDPYLITQLFGNLSPLLDIMETIGDNPLADPKTKAMFEGMQGISKLNENRPIPLICNSVGTPGYKFICSLPQKYLQCTQEELNSEATLFGKIQRIIPKGQKYEVFSLVSAFSSTIPNITKKQQKELQNDLEEKGVSEIIEGPAVLVIPLAIYR